MALFRKAPGLVMAPETRALTVCHIARLLVDGLEGHVTPAKAGVQKRVPGPRRSPG